MGLAKWSFAHSGKRAQLKRLRIMFNPYKMLGVQDVENIDDITHDGYMWPGMLSFGPLSASVHLTMLDARIWPEDMLKKKSKEMARSEEAVARHGVLTVTQHLSGEREKCRISTASVLCKVDA